MDHKIHVDLMQDSRLAGTIDGAFGSKIQDKKYSWNSIRKLSATVLFYGNEVDPETYIGKWTTSIGDDGKMKDIRDVIILEDGLNIVAITKDFEKNK